MIQRGAAAGRCTTGIIRSEKVAGRKEVVSAPNALKTAAGLGRHLRLPPSGLCSIAKVRGALDGTADGPYLRGINLPRATLGGDERVDVLGRLLFPRRLGDEI